MAHPEGGALGRLLKVNNSGRRHNDSKRRRNFGGRQYDRKGRHGNFGGGATITQQGDFKISEGGTMVSEGGTMISEETFDPRGRHHGLRWWHNNLRG